jgi:hypothetical protein
VIKYDFFVSHASEDKESVVRPLVALLKSRGFRVWYDEDVLRIGDSLSARIDSGLAESRFGLVVLSRAFFTKHWTKRELQGLVALDEQGRSKILPIWHGVSKHDIAEFSPTPADVIAGNTDRGLGQLVDAIAATVQMVGFTGPTEPAVVVSGGQTHETRSGTVAGTVIFVHGLYSASAGAFVHAGLKDQAFFGNWEFASFQHAGRIFGAAGKSLDSTVASLIRFTEDSFMRRPSGKLVIIAHSVGGLIAMEAILGSVRLREALKAFVTIAVPTAGLRYPSLLGFLNKGLREISVGGRRIDVMNARWSQQFGDHPPFIVESIASSDDVVVPVSMAALPGARVTLVQGSHSDVYQQTTVIKVLERILTAEQRQRLTFLRCRKYSWSSASETRSGILL